MGTSPRFHCTARRVAPILNKRLFGIERARPAFAVDETAPEEHQREFVAGRRKCLERARGEFEHQG